MFLYLSVFLTFFGVFSWVVMVALRDTASTVNCHFLREINSASRTLAMISYFPRRGSWYYTYSDAHVALKPVFALPHKQRWLDEVKFISIRDLP